MKKSIATVISVAGVLGAGAAAYAVNSSVLSATSSNDLVSATAAVETFAPSSPDMASGLGVTAAGSSAAAPTTPVVEEPIAASTRTTYKVGDAGNVVLDTADGSLDVVSVSPGAGWTAQKIERERNEIEVYFVSSTTKVEFTARLVSSRIVTDVETEQIATGTTKPSYRDDNDDDDDRYENHDDDDHDRDDHHDDDHDEREDD